MTNSISDLRSTHLLQAKLFAEIARRSQDPADGLPNGDVSRALIVLWQEAAFWALAASGAEVSSGDLPRALAEAPRESVERAAGGAEWLPALAQALESSSRTTTESAAGAAMRIAVLAGFVTRLLGELERPARERTRARALFFGKRAAIALAVVAALTLLALLVFRRPDLTPLAARSLSSKLHGCHKGECGNATFHTKEEKNPWVSYDFKEPRELHGIDVENRTDCCYDRAVPLVVETSDNGEVWTEQGRTERAFVTWSTDFRARARYVRLRVAAKTNLHFRRVVIR